MHSEETILKQSIATLYQILTDPESAAMEKMQAISLLMKTKRRLKELAREEAAAAA